MNDDLIYLKRELDRVQGRTFDFGSYYGWRVEQVCKVNRRYLMWCLEAVPLRQELRSTIIRVLSRTGRTRLATIQAPKPTRDGLAIAGMNLGNSVPVTSKMGHVPPRLWNTGLDLPASPALLHQKAETMTANPTEPQNTITAIQRDDPSLGPAQLIADYEAGVELLRAAVAGMTREDVLAHPIAGKWSTLEVVCHVCDSEQFFADRMKRTLALLRPLLVAADPQPYPEAVRYHGRDLEEELALITLTRRQMARILKLVPAEAWQRTGVHTEGGLVTLRQLILHATRHLKHHVAFIAEKQQALAAESRFRHDVHQVNLPQEEREHDS